MTRDLENGRECYLRRAWAGAFEALYRADRQAPLGAGDLDRLATAAYLIGRDADYLAYLERAYHAHLAAGAEREALRAAFWLGLRWLFRGEVGRANGWFERARRGVERQRSECVERGYLLLAAAQQGLDAGAHEAAVTDLQGAIAIAEDFKDRDLLAVARHLLGRARLLQGQVNAGLALLDEAMLAVTGGELSPIVTGLIYCSVIEGCHEVYAIERAREWTHALAAWCDEQPEMVAFSGVCRVHRAEILQHRGAWPEALVEAERALERCRGINRQATAAALYQQGEVLRLRGDFTAAEAAYREASQAGLDPQPGLALLRLAQHRTDAAVAAIKRAVGTTGNSARRAQLLPAYVQIVVAGGDIEAARRACEELDEVASRLSGALPRAMAAHARGALELAEGNTVAALGTLRRAWQAWEEVQAPYMGARARVLLGLGCRALGDDEGALLELSGARAVFERLGAAPDLAQLDELEQPRPSQRSYGLTPRELEVLRRVAAGKTNRAIATELQLSEKTIERHIGHIFDKLDVPSRAAATAFAYENHLL